MAELDIVKKIMLKASELKNRLFRNNSAMAWAGKAFIQHNKDGSKTVTIKNAYPIKAGLCNGSGDTIGWTKIQITEQMIGKTVAIFTSCEIKTDIGKITEDQKNFIEVVNKAGGVAFVARSAEEYDAAIKSAIQNIRNSV